MLNGDLVTAWDGARGFDCNAIVTAPIAREFRAGGYHFAVRYVRRNARHDFDLTSDEAATILASGLGLMAVQHVESADAWTPTEDKGVAYGSVAADECEAIGFPPGSMVWCDLEGVTVGTPHADVIAYCNRWHTAVAAAGFVPGLYVGWHAGLSGDELYRSLRFTHYWAAYNLNDDQMPIKRGVQMRQYRVKKLASGFEFDPDVIRRDNLGGLPTVLAPDNWGTP